MLKCTVWIPKPRTHYAHSWLQCDADQFRQPVGRDDLQIIVEQPQHLALRQCDGAVIQRGIIEGAPVAQHPYPRVCLQFIEILQGGGVIRSVVNDQDFVIRVCRLG